MIKGKVQINKSEKKKRDDVKKHADWIKDIKNKIQSDKEIKADEDITYVGIGEIVYLRKNTIGRTKLQPYWNDKEWIVTRRKYNIYEILDDEGKRRVINKESIQLCKPKYIDWKDKRKETDVIEDTPWLRSGRSGDRITLSLVIYHITYLLL